MMPMGQPPMPPMPPMPPQPHQTWLYGGGTTNPYDPNAQHPLGVTEGY